MPVLPRLILWLKTGLSFGVVVTWVMCALAALLPLAPLHEDLYGTRHSAGTDVAITAAGLAAMVTLAFFYTRFLSTKYRRLTGREPWFRHPIHGAHTLFLRAVGRSSTATRGPMDIAASDGETRPR